MNARELGFVDLISQYPDAWMCGVCGMIWHPKIYLLGGDTPKECAERCCKEACDDCGEPAERGWVICRPCRDKRETAKEAERFAKAKKVLLSDYDGKFLYSDGIGDEGYFQAEDVETTLEEEIGAGHTVPPYAWGCSREKASFDLSDAVENNLVDNHHEDAWEQVNQRLIEAAQIVVDKALEDVASYHEEHRVAVMLPIPVLDAEGCAVRFDPPTLPEEPADMISEAALAAAVRSYLEADSWEVFSEVSLDYQRRGASPVGDGRADIVARRDGQLAVVECKATLSFELIAQGQRWIPYANLIWLAFPDGKRTVGRDAAFEIARGLGFGLLQVRDEDIRPFGSPHVRTHLESDALLASLREGHKTHAAAGSPGGGQYSSFKETCEHLAAYVAAHPGCKLSEAVAAIKHHYGSKASAENALRKMMKKGLVPEVYVGWRQGLFSTEADARRGMASDG